MDVTSIASKAGSSFGYIHLQLPRAAIKVLHVLPSGIFCCTFGHSPLASEALISEVETLVLVMPGTNATSERTFSALRRVKTYLRATMTQQRLNHLMLLHMRRDRSLSMTEVANAFVESSEYRTTRCWNILQSGLGKRNTSQ